MGRRSALVAWGRQQASPAAPWPSDRTYTHMGDSVERQLTNMLLHRHESDHFNSVQRLNDKDKWSTTQVLMCVYNRETTCGFISPLRQQQLLCLLHFLHPTHHHSTPIHRPLFYATDHWNLALDVPGVHKDKHILLFYLFRYNQ